jgi:hypothetical protein
LYGDFTQVAGNYLDHGEIDVVNERRGGGGGHRKRQKTIGRRG